MANYRTLVVAPKTDLLLVDDEVQQVVNLLGAKLLQGSQANIHGLLAILAEPYDIVWFATHGDERGVYLSDGILNTAELTALARSSSTQLLVLNTCSSRPVALSIYDELRIQLVCTLRPIPDRSAFITGTIFARKIAGGETFREAYLSAKPGQNNTYLFLPEDGTEMPAPRPQNLETDIYQLAALVRRLEILVSGSPDYNVNGLVPTVNMLVDKVDALKADFLVLRANQIFNKRLLIGMTIITILLLISMVVLVFQKGIV
jgi:hypothetical protein